MISDERIMGFVEGEGCFSIAIGKYIDRRPRKGSGRSNIRCPHLFRVTPTFRVGVCEADGQILEEIKETLGVGQIYVQKRSVKHNNYQNFAQYYAQGIKDCLKLKEFFQRHKFYTRKGHDFQLWCECLKKINSGRHLRKEGILEICILREKMNFRKTKNKWSAAEIEKIFDMQPIHQTAHFNEKQTQTKLIHNQDFDLKKWLLPAQGNYMRAKLVAEKPKNAENVPETPK